MTEDIDFQKILQATRIIRPPKHTLATFGTTTFHYVLASPLPDSPDCCRLRQGSVTAERPKILTSELWKKRFEGFGENEESYGRDLERFYGDALRALEYTFRNVLESTSIENTSLPAMIDRVSRSMEQDNSPRHALLQAPDGTWALSIMKFIVDMSLRSFPSNIRELEERGLFDPAIREEQKRRRQIEQLFQEARQDASKIKPLAEHLKGSGLFAEYEDRFFALFPHA